MAAIERATGQRIGKRQVEDLAQAAAADVDSFYTRARPAPGSCPDTDVLALSADGAGITMRPEALRPRTRRAAAARDNKLATRLSRGEVRHRKRIAEVGAVYDITPAPRTPADIIRPAGAGPPATKTPGPAARGKWLKPPGACTPKPTPPPKPGSPARPASSWPATTTRPPPPSATPPPA